MINYTLLVSRQGTCDNILAYGLLMSIFRQGPTCKMVPHDAAEAEGQDRQGRDAAGSRTSYENVQLLGVQGCVPHPLYLAAQAQHPCADTKVVYRRYASLFFVCGIGSADNELITLEIIHRYVEVLDRYFGNVSGAFGLHQHTLQ